jgi:hypothetical protein
MTTGVLYYFIDWICFLPIALLGFTVIAHHALLYSLFAAKARFQVVQVDRTD